MIVDQIIEQCSTQCTFDIYSVKQMELPIDWHSLVSSCVNDLWLNETLVII